MNLDENFRGGDRDRSESRFGLFCTCAALLFFLLLAIYG